MFLETPAKANIQITCHIDEQAMSNFMGLGGQALGRWGIVNATAGMIPNQTGSRCQCKSLKKLTDNIQQEFLVQML